MSWGSSEIYDPIEDMKKAREKLSKPDISYWKRRAKIEEQVEKAIKILTELNYTPEEIELIFIKYGVWSEVF